MIAYLLASLPEPSPSEPPAIDPSAFVERCRGFVDEARWRDLAALLGGGAGHRVGVTPPATGGTPSGAPVPDEPSDPVARTWLDLSAQVDDAVAVQRAANARRDAGPYLRRPRGYRVDLVESVGRAFDAPNPATRERALDELRWRLAGELAAADPDGFGALYARAVRWQLAWRWSGWDAAAGWTALEASLRTLEAPHA